MGERGDRMQLRKKEHPVKQRGEKKTESKREAAEPKGLQMKNSVKGEREGNRRRG